MDQPSLGLRLNRALLALRLRAQGKTMDPSKNGLGTIISTGKAGTQTPTDFGDEYAEWFERAERVVIAMERDASTVMPAKPRKTTKDLLQVIRKYEGRDMTYVAFVEGCSPDLVRKVRTIAGLVPADGSRPLKPLTSREWVHDASHGAPTDEPPAPAPFDDDMAGQILSMVDDSLPLGSDTTSVTNFSEAS